MELKNAVGLIIGVFVGVLLLATLLIPVVSSVSDENVTYVNNGVRMSPVGDNDVTISYDGNLNWTINGVVYPASERPITQGTIMLYGVGHSTRTAYLYVNSENAYNRYNVMNGDTDTYVYHGSSKTVDVTTTLASNGNTYNSTYSYVGEVYYYDESGSYIWSGERPTPAYVPDDWDKFNAWSVGSTNFYAIIGADIMVDGVLSPEGVTSTLVLGDIPNVTGVKTIDSYTINIPDLEPINCRGYILPYEVHGINENRGQYSALWSIIPILGLVALFVPIVYFIGSNRRD